jgi:hypothetical protein
MASSTTAESAGAYSPRSPRRRSPAHARTAEIARARLLRAAVGFALVPPTERELRLLHHWLDSWTGIGRIAVGMARQGYDLQLTRYDERGGRATFYTTGMEHSPTSATGTGLGAHAMACDAAGGVGGIEQVRGVRLRQPTAPRDDGRRDRVCHVVFERWVERRDKVSK